MAEDTSKEVVDSLDVFATDDDDQTPVIESRQMMSTSSPSKRGIAVKSTLSPQKILSAQTVVKEISTFVFFDFETTGLFLSNDGMPSLTNIHYPSASKLEEFILRTQRESIPRVTEFSFVAVTRKEYVKTMEQMKARVNPTDNATNINVRVTKNVHTRQINPGFKSFDEFEKHIQRLKSRNELKHLSHTGFLERQETWNTYRTFKGEWDSLLTFLRSLPKPVCLIAHNGLQYDMRILYGELDRAGIVQKGRSHVFDQEDEIYFADSWQAFRYLETEHFNDMVKVVPMVHWNKFSEVSKTEVANVEATTTTSATTITTVAAEINEIGSDLSTPLKSTEEKKVVQNVKLGVKRLFSETISISHPLEYLVKKDWSPALVRRTKPEFFQSKPDGSWSVNQPVWQKHRSLKLTDIHEQVINKPFDAHFAQDDCEATLQLCLSFGYPLLQYLDRYSCELPF